MKPCGGWALLIVLMLFVAGCGDDDVSSPRPPRRPRRRAPHRPPPAPRRPRRRSATTTAAGTTTTTPPRRRLRPPTTWRPSSPPPRPSTPTSRRRLRPSTPGSTPMPGTLDPAVEPIVEALDARPLGALIPAGLSLPLETAVLAAFTDLDSRIAALAGGTRYLGYPDQAGASDCLEGGGEAAARFPGDLAAARTLATREAPPSAAAGLRGGRDPGGAAGGDSLDELGLRLLRRTRLRRPHRGRLGRAHCGRGGVRGRPSAAGGGTS